MVFGVVVRYGPNVFPSPPMASWFEEFFDALKDPIVMVSAWAKQQGPTDAGRRGRGGGWRGVLQDFDGWRVMCLGWRRC